MFILLIIKKICVCKKVIFVWVKKINKNQRLKDTLQVWNEISTFYIHIPQIAAFHDGIKQNSKFNIRPA